MAATGEAAANAIARSPFILCLLRCAWLVFAILCWASLLYAGRGLACFAVLARATLRRTYLRYAVPASLCLRFAILISAILHFAPPGFACFALTAAYLGRAILRSAQQCSAACFALLGFTTLRSALQLYAWLRLLCSARQDYAVRFFAKLL